MKRNEMNRYKKTKIDSSRLMIDFLVHKKLYKEFCNWENIKVTGIVDELEDVTVKEMGVENIE